MTILPLSFILFAVLEENKTMNDAAKNTSMQQAHADLEHIVNNLFSLAESHHEVTQKNINAALNVGRKLLRDAGGINFSSEETTWQAVNQYNQLETTVTLPKMLLGNEWFLNTDKVFTPVPLVDIVENLLGVTCTVFQKMNDEGDMLRIATNVIKKDGHRAIGTYIPAINPDGKANPVLETVLKGKTYRGRAFVVDRWYITAYEPILDENGIIIAILYVGIPQENVKSLRSAITQVKIGNKGHVKVIDSLGQYIIPPAGIDIGVSIFDAQDKKGRKYVKTMIQKAKDAPFGKANTLKFNDTYNGEIIPRVACFVYYEDWDWIIIAVADENEFTSVVQELGLINDKISHIIIAVCILSLVIVVGVWFLVSKRILLPVAAAIEQLKAIAQTKNGLQKRLPENSYDELGELAKWFNIFMDKLESSLTELESTQKQLIESEKQAALGGLVRGIAHELNTPLGLAMTYNSFAQDKLNALMNDYKQGIFKRSDFEKFGEIMDVSMSDSLENLNRAGKLVQSFKNISVDKSNHNLQKIELNEYIENTVQLIRTKWNDHQYKIIVNCHSKHPIAMVSYPEVIMQILDSLIENSILHGFKDRTEGNIIISISTNEEYAYLDLEDNGHGMDARTLRKIFDPFFTTDMGGEGTGLGAHVVYSLVTYNLKGEISCESSRQKGTIIKIKIPLTIIGA